MSATTKTAREQLAELIQAKGYVMDAQPTTRARTDWDKQALHFDCAISCTSKPQHGYLRAPYSVGSAIPIMWAKENPEAAIAADHAQHPTGWTVFRLADLRTLNIYKHTLHDAAIVERIRAIYRPDVVDVIASHLMDMSGYELGMTFREWWDASGSDTMSESSAPDALEAFESIERSARFLTRTAGSDLERMCELAHEL